MSSGLIHLILHYLVFTGVALAAWLIVGVSRAVWLHLPRSAQRPALLAFGYFWLIFLAIVFVTPFAWMLSTSIKTPTEIFRSDVRWLPTVPTIREQTRDTNGLEKVDFTPIKILNQNGKSVRVAVLEEMEGGLSRIKPIDGGQQASRVVSNGSLSDIHRLSPQWHNYPDALSAFPFLLYTWNTIILCTFTMLGTVLSAALPAYGFARLRWRGRDATFFLLIATIMLPPQVTMLPVFLIFRSLHWTGTMLPLIVPAFFGSAFYVFLLRQFFLTIPQELSDAARIDGCNELGILYRILAPIAKPALATVALLSFTAAWMDFSGPLIYLHDERTYTLAVGLLAFMGRHSGDWNLLMAASTVITIPMLILFFFAQRTYIQGIALTGLKG
jgi:multiple sugar transport system permease protein